MSPYYEKAEGFIGVTGTKEGIRTAPDGNFLPPIAPRVHEVLIQRACKKLGIPVHSRRAWPCITKPINGRAACHYCGQCGRGCRTASALLVQPGHDLPGDEDRQARRSSPDAMARELITDATGKVTAVSYVDKATRTEKQIRCRAVVVAASACESARLLLEFEVAAILERHGEFFGQSSAAISRIRVGYGVGGHDSGARRMPRHDTRRHRRHARVHALVAARQEGQGVSARLSHRARRRLRHAAARRVPRRLRDSRRLRQGR